MKKIISSITFIALILVAIGCATAGSPRMDSYRLQMIKPGETTKDDLISWFGNPMSQTMDPSGRLAFMWMHIEITSIPFGGTKTKNQNLTAAFGTNGVVQQFSVIDDLKDEPPKK